MRTRNKQILVRLDEIELKILQRKIARSKLKQSDYVRLSLLQQEIIVFDDKKEILLELKRIGNNLNQLTRAVHQGKLFASEELEILTSEVHGVWQSLKSLGEEKRVEV